MGNDYRKKATKKKYEGFPFLGTRRVEAPPAPPTQKPRVEVLRYPLPSLEPKPDFVPHLGSRAAKSTYSGPQRPSKKMLARTVRPPGVMFLPNERYYATIRKEIARDTPKERTRGLAGPEEANHPPRIGPGSDSELAGYNKKTRTVDPIEPPAEVVQAARNAIDYAERQVSQVAGTNHSTHALDVLRVLEQNTSSSVSAAYRAAKGTPRGSPEKKALGQALSLRTEVMAQLMKDTEGPLMKVDPLEIKEAAPGLHQGWVERVKFNLGRTSGEERERIAARIKGAVESRQPGSLHAVQAYNDALHAVGGKVKRSPAPEIELGDEIMLRSGKGVPLMSVPSGRDMLDQEGPPENSGRENLKGHHSRELSETKESVGVEDGQVTRVERGSGGYRGRASSGKQMQEWLNNPEKAPLWVRKEILAGRHPVKYRYGTSASALEEGLEAQRGDTLRLAHPVKDGVGSWEFSDSPEMRREQVPPLLQVRRAGPSSRTTEDGRAPVIHDQARAVHPSDAEEAAEINKELDKLRAAGKKGSPRKKVFPKGLEVTGGKGWKTALAVERDKAAKELPFLRKRFEELRKWGAGPEGVKGWDVPLLKVGAGEAVRKGLDLKANVRMLEALAKGGGVTVKSARGRGLLRILGALK